jgi:hypothetical protein
MRQGKNVLALKLPFISPKANYLLKQVFYKEPVFYFSRD